MKKALLFIVTICIVFFLFSSTVSPTFATHANATCGTQGTYCATASQPCKAGDSQRLSGNNSSCPNIQAQNICCIPPHAASTNTPTPTQGANCSLNKQNNQTCLADCECASNYCQSGSSSTKVCATKPTNTPGGGGTNTPTPNGNVDCSKNKYSGSCNDDCECMSNNCTNNNQCVVPTNTPTQGPTSTPKPTNTPGGPTNTPTPTSNGATNTPTPTDDDDPPPPPANSIVVNVAERKVACIMGFFCFYEYDPIDGATVTLYRQGWFGTLTNVGTKNTVSGSATWTGLASAQYRAELNSKGPGKSTWPIVMPSNGSNIYTNIPLGASRMFALEDPGAPPPPPPPPGGTNYTVDGDVYGDAGNNTCAAGQIALPGTTITLNDSTGNELNTATGQTYTFNGTTDSALGHTLTIVNSSGAGYSVVGYRVGSSGAFTPYSTSQLSIDIAADPTQTIDFCLQENSVAEDPWFMTEIGSVRQQVINNPVPPSKLPSTNDNLASVFYSTNGITDLGAALGTKWEVNNEYSEVSSTSRPGNASFSFYMNKANVASIVPANLPGYSGTGDYTMTLPIDNLGQSNIFLVNGDLTINPSNGLLSNGRRYVFLATGDINFTKGVTIAPGSTQSLLIFAAQNDIRIANTIGQAAPSSTNFDMQAILSAENDIIIEDGGTVCPAADRRINIEGTLIANADNPFGIDPAGGILNNQRNLCADNANYPALMVKSRLSFITELTDFYKVSSRFWNEVSP